MKLSAHIIFWLVIHTILTLVFSAYYSSWQESFYFVSMLMPVVTGTCYFFNLVLVPRFLLKKKYFLFSLYSVYMLIVSLYLEMVVIMLAFIFMAHYSYNNMSPVSSDVFVLAVTLYLIVFFYSFILLVKHTLSSEKAINSLKTENSKYEAGQFTVRSNRQMRTLLYDDVLFIESLGDYVRISQEGDDQIMTKERISKLEDRLPETFIRIHRSFIVNKSKVTSFSREEICLGEHQLPISRSYKKAVLEKLESK